MQSNTHTNGKRPKLLLHALHCKSAEAAPENDFPAVSPAENSDIMKTKYNLLLCKQQIEKK